MAVHGPRAVRAGGSVGIGPLEISTGWQSAWAEAFGEGSRLDDSQKPFLLAD